MKIKVLIVDDSLLYCSAIEQSLANEDDIQVIGIAKNGVEALDFMRRQKPDVITLDVDMPEMDGLETLRAIQDMNRSLERPIGVIMVSSYTKKGADITIEALAAGAFDFIAKPDTPSPTQNIERLRHQLTVKIRYFVSRRMLSGGFSLFRPQTKVQTLASTPPIKASGKEQAVLIGVSTGGPKALAMLLPPLCAMTSVPILIVQHIPPAFVPSLANYLNAKCRHCVKEADNYEPVKPDHIYLAPGDKHLLLRRQQGQLITVVNDQPPENGIRPSVDVLFRSAAVLSGINILAVVLTGMGVDGVNGAQSIKRAGGYLIAQDQTSSVVWGMPGSVAAAGYADQILPLDKIAQFIVAYFEAS